MADLSNELAPPEHKMDEDDWKERYPDMYRDSEPPPNAESGGGVSLEGTLAVVKERVWSLGDAALKSVAEVLVGFGISPTILGYSEEDLLEDEEIEGVGIRIEKDEVLSKSSFSMRSEENISRRRADEASQQLPDADEEEEVFARQEDRSWRGSSDDLSSEGEYKKDK